MNFHNLLEKQLQFARVANACQTKIALIDQLLAENGIEGKIFRLFIRAFKQEQKLEAWVRPVYSPKYVLLKTYDFTAFSGQLGPKRREGDGQMPEGIYKVTNFNPQSAFHLSLRINYPNTADFHFADQANPGGDIYLHGGNASTGCIAVGDDNIEELYLLSVYAAVAGNLPDVHIFPAYLTDAGFQSLLNKFSSQMALTDFWQVLKTISDDFEQTHELNQIEIDSKGCYHLAG